jgi:hypothetical protein
MLDIKLPNVAMEKVALILCIIEVLGSIPSPEISYLDFGFPCFSSITPGKY